METARGHPRVGRAGIPRPAAGDQCSLPVDNGLQPQARRPGRCYPRTEDRDPVQRRKDVRSNGVIPIAVEILSKEIYQGEFFIADFDTCWIDTSIQFSLNDQSLLRGSVSN